jgi:hypothetical protein
VRSALFVTYKDVMDWEFAHSVVRWEDGSAGIAEDLIYSLADEGSPENFGASELGVVVFV